MQDKRDEAAATLSQFKKAWRADVTATSPPVRGTP
jgi:hypothetical protein